MTGSPSNQPDIQASSTDTQGEAPAAVVAPAGTLTTEVITSATDEGKKRIADLLADTVSDIA